LQKFVFPEGVTYNREKGLFLTSKANSLFEPIAQLNSITGGDKEKQDGINAVLSNWVGSAGQVSNLLIHDLKVIGELINLNPGFIRTEYSFNSDDNMTMLIVLV
jgi:hypothetical protein